MNGDLVVHEYGDDVVEADLQAGQEEGEFQRWGMRTDLVVEREAPQ